MNRIKLPLPAACLIGVSVLMWGCSSSQPAPSAPSFSVASANSVSSDPQVDAALEQSCYQCHSSGGHAPWYAAVSPTYIAANSARKVLNFSEWPTYDPQKKSEALKNIEQAVQGGSMPPGDYTALDHSARLSDVQKELLLKWAALSPEPAH